MLDASQNRIEKMNLVNSLLHIRSRLEDYLRLVSQTDPSQLPPPDSDINSLIARTNYPHPMQRPQSEAAVSSHESFGIGSQGRDNSYRDAAAAAAYGSSRPQSDAKIWTAGRSDQKSKRSEAAERLFPQRPG